MNVGNIRNIYEHGTNLFFKFFLLKSNFFLFFLFLRFLHMLQPMTGYLTIKFSLSYLSRV